MGKKNFLMVLIVLLGSYYLQAQSKSDCELRSLFSKMPNHEERDCKFQEFDSHSFRKSNPDGSYETLLKEGEKSIVAYNWLGDWNKRPSELQIYKNYQTAIEKQGGEILYLGSIAHFKLKKLNDIYYIEVQTDGSGMYYVTTLKESIMKQVIVYTAQEIDQNMRQDGQITFYGIYFDLNKASLKPESANSLKEIANYLKSNTNKQFYMVGHTDNTGTHDHNLKLSKERSQTVVNELIKMYGISPSQVSSEGVGALCPVANNTTEDGKAKNRRVVMVLKQ